MTELDDFLDDVDLDDEDDDDFPDLFPDDDGGELVEAPMDPHKLCLNPGHTKHEKNPLCPECEEEIRPKITDKRQFVCGCDTVWQFTFDRAEEQT